MVIFIIFLVTCFLSWSIAQWLGPKIGIGKIETLASKSTENARYWSMLYINSLPVEKRQEAMDYYKSLLSNTRVQLTSGTVRQNELFQNE
jgi:hypothetical protein